MLTYYQPLLHSLVNTHLERWLMQLPEQITSGLCEQRYGDLATWRQALGALPNTIVSYIDLKNTVTIGQRTDCNPESLAQLEQCLKTLIPWRKGPINIHGICIDTEWHSDWKWQRVLPHIAPLANRQILDVGCGNGYYCLRSYGEGAQRVIGIDPSPRFIVQFYMMKHFLGDIPVDVLPLGIESLPEHLQAFDSTFSMGVLYHRRSPMDHLKELKATLQPGGQLILETLLIDGKRGDTLVPEGRYAMMNNVWFIPSADTLISWLRKCGFKNPRLVDLNQTSTKEQRQTEWMRFHSLAEFLDPKDNRKTMEGHPAPLRGVFLAEA
ncbi:tRNA 5-methoxyuridine(34)/uridine 5-oxyacetic acid(34) synthase CmoB [Candidatus Endobugula sertula]|uniref:tRNA U34 carboxymethyltransferase n=1 Tax=Candidatus Endobugula sertula TaxID=62101 RepID=A0A1D2QQB7_9GAMM|nr:tRNA 5-methoxyuridine(34)/uridine 5-oxyacetic acid(34) synthase CmoB [Candidatus Endobugula sertula]